MHRPWLIALALWGCGPSGKPVVPPRAVNPCAAPTAQIEQLAADLDVAPDPADSDITPAVRALIALGLPGACGVAARLTARSPETRLHAQRVVEGVASAEYGFRAGRGYPDEYSEEHVTATVAAIDYAHDAVEPQRRAGATRWRQWIEGAHEPAPTPDDGPAPDEMRAALDRVRPQLEQCGAPMDLKVTFDGNGYVKQAHGTASTAQMYRSCLQATLTAIRLPVFARASVWTRYPRL